MKSLLFISVFLAFSCTSDTVSSILSKFDNESVEYTWQVDVKALIIDLVNEENKHNTAFQKSLLEASKAQDTSKQTFVTLFGKAYEKYADKPLSTLFSPNTELNIDENTPNKAILKSLQSQTDALINQHMMVIQKRLTTFGEKVLRIAPIENTDQFLLELQGKNTQIEFQATTVGELGFWELHQDIAIFNFLTVLNDSLNTEEIEEDSLSLEMDYGPLFELLMLNYPQSNSISATLGYAKPSDTESVMKLLTGPTARKILGNQWSSIRFVWDSKSFESTNGETFFALYALNTNNRRTSELNHTHIMSSFATPNHYGNGFAVSLKINPEGTIIWERMTTDNVGKQIAITLDNKVYSAPMVNEPIPNGNVSISGGFETVQEANDFSDILSLKSVLPSPLKLLKKTVHSNKN